MPLGGVPDVDGGVDGVFGFVGGIDCVGQFALASITDPSGQVLVVGDVVDGVNVWVHNGSFGFFVQSTAGGVVPEVDVTVNGGSVYMTGTFFRPHHYNAVHDL